MRRGDHPGSPSRGKLAVLDVTFYGVRGSTPCGCDANRRYGGNTACVVVTRPDDPQAEPIIFDLGTGLRFYGETQPMDGSFRGTVFLSHLHWDHIQGLPFFACVDRPGARLDIFAPPQAHGTLTDAFSAFMQPPYFPIRWTDLRGDIRFHDVADTEVSVGDARVAIRDCPHIGPTNGYRLDWAGCSVAYLSDHQAPHSLDSIADSVLETCSGVDLLIHDAQYLDHEWVQKSHWGHCTVGYALMVAREAGARRLALFHHDPAHNDDELDRILADTRRQAERWGVEVLAAAEGESVRLRSATGRSSATAGVADAVASAAGQRSA